MTNPAVANTPFLIHTGVFPMVRRVIALLIIVFANASGPAHAQVVYEVVAEIPVGDAPVGVSVNPATGLLYTADFLGDTISVVDLGHGAVVATVPSPAGNPYDLVANPATNKIYVANGAGSNSVTVIDGNTNTVLKVLPVGALPSAIALNVLTNRLYVSNFIDRTVSVIDGATDTVIDTISIPGTFGPEKLSVDAISGVLYVPTLNTDQVTLVDVAGDANLIITSTTVGDSPFVAAANPLTGLVYVSNLLSDTVSVIDGDPASGNFGDVVDEFATGDGPFGITIDLLANVLFVVHQFDETVQVVDGATHTVIATLPVGMRPLFADLDPLTGMLYVANGISDSVTVIAPIGPIGLIDMLKDSVVSLGLADGLEVSLVSLLEEASGKLADGKAANDRAACNKLEEFADHVAAQSGKKISAGDAQILTSEALEVMQLIECE